MRESKISGGIIIISVIMSIVCIGTLTDIFIRLNRYIGKRNLEKKIVSGIKEYSNAPYIEIDHYNGDIAIVHCYEIYDTGDLETSHTATYDWVEVNTKTGESKGMFGFEGNIFEK